MRILAFFAHPDDETILAGGTLALLSKFGCSVHYLIATRGEGGEVGDPPLCNRTDLGQIRELETETAIQALGGTTLRFMNYVDPVVGLDNQLYSFSEDRMGVVSLLDGYVKQNAINIIISHGSNGEYGHPAHKFVYSVVKTLIEIGSPELMWYTVQADYPETKKPHLTNKDDAADWVADVSSVLPQKLTAAQAHKTQHALFVRRKQRELGREVELSEVISSEESFRFAFGDRDVLKSLLSQEGVLKESFERDPKLPARS